jgi:hypothetical protein
MLAPLAVVPVSAVGYHNPDWYMLVNGNLSTDTYDFYPWKEQSVDFGFSKFGELIYWNDALDRGVGIQYPGWDVVGEMVQYPGANHVDPFANEIVPEELYLNGWFMEVRYTHRTLRDRRVLAMAMFADMTVDGNDWQNGWPIHIPLDQPGGGRKTTGYAESEDIQVLYNGPRRFIAQTTTHVHDWLDSQINGTQGVVDEGETWPLVDVMLTFVFNKVKKQVIIYKDIKQVIVGKQLDSPLDIQFSNREEWDFASASTYRSWAHFYHQNFTTCYGPEWHMAPGIMREYILTKNVQADCPGCPTYVRLIDPDGDGPYDFPVVSGSVRVYYIDPITEELIFLEPGLDWHFDTEGECQGEDAKIVLHPRQPPEGPGSIWTEDEVQIVYKLWKYYDGCEEETPMDSTSPEGDTSDGIPHMYDLLQVVSEDMKWVGWKAFWPTLSDYTPDGWNQWPRPLIWVGLSDPIDETQSNEPDIGFSIGEWDFQLGDPTFPTQFRGVEVVGITDRHDGDDAHRPGGSQVLDRELLYQVEEIFNPWDLKKAVHKETKTWVEWQVDSGGTYITNHRPFYEFSDADWGLYNTEVPPSSGMIGDKVFSERVYDLTADRLLNRFEGDYSVSTNLDGYGVIEDLPVGHDFKIMYHTLPQVSAGLEIGLSPNMTITDANNTMYSIPVTIIAPTWTDNLGVEHAYNATFGPLQITIKDDTLPWTFDEGWESDLEEIEFKVYAENANNTIPGKHITVIDDKNDIFPKHTFVDTEAVKIEMDVDALWYSITSSNDLDVTWPLDSETLHVNNLKHILEVEIFAQMYDNQTLFVETVYNVTALYDEMLGGRWEHTVVGKDAASVDSAGAALITAAFKNKQREIGIAAEDMMDDNYKLRIPWVMRKFGDGYMREDYYYNASAGTPCGDRTALKDDWCHTWAITGANIIASGGPAANLVSYYANDFTDAFFGIGVSPEGYAPVGSPWRYEIAAPACWNKNSYSSNDDPDIGYAVVATYHDINGTTLLPIWGMHGRDTYYAARFFHEELIYEFQTFPKCATAVILKIDYTDEYHPTFDLVEVLGTISEHRGAGDTIYGVEPEEVLLEWRETWAARKWMNDNEPDYLNTYPTTSEDYYIDKGGLHDP